ncbi:endonuclease/exonuclease/phosphatase family protein [Streptomyces sp. NRRL F-5053]|uniref:endonuclease/exonuclease/phosphatase family protein n=1 Tax=Streptomyces sp. NRRL F-5053 TaxID=1463854 RepID=UPI0004CBAAED|nr:endonuclease/exonuclease/phosphatase family protein [Streptomyces sp. NRRL F-5053]
MARAHMAESGHTGDTVDGGSRAGSRAWRDRWGVRGPGIWRRGLVLAALAVLLALAMMLHADIPNSVGNLGSLWETFLPWSGVPILLLLAGALLRRSATALIAVLLPLLVWANLFAGQLTSKSGTGGDLTVVTHNVNAENLDPQGTAKALAASGADVVALEEVTSKQADTFEKGLERSHRHHKLLGTVGLWSKYPMRDVRSVDLKMGWPRAMRATVRTPKGDVAVYVAHLPSVRVQFRSGFTAGKRDGSAAALGYAIRHEKADKIVLLGDLNGTMNDRSLSPITSQMRSVQGAAGDGMGFSWPASFPMARIDQIMVKGATPVSAWSLPSTGSDHLPIAASVDLSD